METGSKSPIIFALGNTFIDCSAVGSHELLEKYGLGFGLPGNLTPDQYPVLEDLKSCPNYHELTAGSAINTVRCINYVLKKDHNIENSVLYFGAISKDDSGKTVKDFLDSEGIQYAFDEHDDNYTGKCAIIIVDGERTPVSNCGVNDFIRTEHFLNNKHMIDSWRMIYLEGFFVSSNFKMVSELCKYASETSKTFAFNLCGEHWITTYRDRFDEIIPYTDMLFGNIAEFKVLTDNKYEEAEQLIKEVAKLPKNNTNNRIVLISMGKEGAIFDNYSFENDTHDILTVPSVELEQSLVVDTWWAGDTFVGGFLAGYLTNQGFTESIQLGHKMASIVIQKIGCYFEL